MKVELSDPAKLQDRQKSEFALFLRFSPLRNFWGPPGENVPTKVVMQVNAKISDIDHLAPK